MAVLDSIRNFLRPMTVTEPETIVPAPPSEYSIGPLMPDHLNEVLRLNIRCFRNGDNYTKHTFEYLLNEPRTRSYRVTDDTGEMVAFAVIMINDNGAAHLTTIGVAPEHRRRGIAARLLDHIEKAIKAREIGTLMLEVRVGNEAAMTLYNDAGYTTAQRINKYYSNGEDCFLMMKAIL